MSDSELSTAFAKRLLREDTCSMRYPQNYCFCSGRKHHEISPISAMNNQETMQPATHMDDSSDVTACLISQHVLNSDLNSAVEKQAELSDTDVLTAQSPEKEPMNICSEHKEPECSDTSQYKATGEGLLNGHFDAPKDDHANQLIPEAADFQSVMCLEHGKYERDIYCRDCGDCVCVRCCTDKHKHCDHNIASLEDAFKETKPCIDVQLLSLSSVAGDMSKCVCRLTELGNELFKKQKNIEQQIHECFQTIRTALEYRENELISSLPSKRLQVEAHKQSIESLRTQVTDKTQSCTQQFQSNDMLQVVSSKKSVSLLLSTVNDEVRLIDWREEKYDNHLEFKCDVDSIIQSIRQQIQLTDENVIIKEKLFSECKPILLKIDNEMKSRMNECVCEVEQLIANMSWNVVETRLGEVTLKYLSQLLAVNELERIKPEWFDELIRPFVVEWNSYVSEKNMELRVKWERIVASDFEEVLRSQFNQVVTKLDVTSSDLFESSWNRTMNDLSSSLTLIGDKYGKGDIHVGMLMESRMKSGKEVLTNFRHSYEGLSSIAEEMKHQIISLASEMKESFSDLLAHEIESRWSNLANQCKIRLVQAISETTLGPLWANKMVLQFLSMWDAWLMKERHELWSTWNDMITIESNSVLQAQVTQFCKQLDLTTVEAFLQSWGPFRQETMARMQEICSKYRLYDDRLMRNTMMDDARDKAADIVFLYREVYVNLFELVNEMKQDMLNDANVESKLSLHEDMCKSRVAQTIDEMELSESCKEIISGQFLSMLDLWMAERRVQANQNVEDDHYRRLLPCMTEPVCRRTLVSILKKTRGEEKWNAPDAKGNRVNWRADLHLSQWDGMAVKRNKRIQIDRNGMVSQLWLDQLSMVGDLPECICRLTSLKKLSVSDNQLSSLPDSVGNLPNLDALYVKRNPCTSTEEAKSEVRRRFSKPGLEVLVK